MIKIKFVGLILFGVLQLYARGQVAIGVELGGSYSPFVLYAATVDNESNRIDYLLGLNAQIYLNENFLLNTRVSYVDREDFKWRDACLCPDYLHTTYTQNDLNLELDFVYKISKLVFGGVGPSLLKKIDTEYTRTDINGETIRNYNNLYYGVNGLIGVQKNRFLIKLLYVRRIKPDDLDFYLTEGQNRIDLTLGYNLFRSRNN